MAVAISWPTRLRATRAATVVRRGSEPTALSTVGAGAPLTPFAILMKPPPQGPTHAAALARRKVTRQSLADRRFVRPFAHRLGDEALWRLTRESVARGVALRLFAGLIVPVGQMLLAVLAALPARANVVVASMTTFVTNPLTFPAIYYAAYRVGCAIVGDVVPPEGGNETSAVWLYELAGWLAGATVPTFIGLLLFALCGLVLGYLGVRLGWRGWIVWRWARRASRRQT